MKQSIAEKIQQRRLQILVHSYIYYILDDNIVSDETWGRWAKELLSLQKKYPKQAEEAVYADQFLEFDGSSGAFFQFDDSIVHRAKKLLQYHTQPIIPVSVVSQKKKSTVVSKKKKPFGRKLF